MKPFSKHFPKRKERVPGKNSFCFESIVKAVVVCVFVDGLIDKLMVSGVNSVVPVLCFRAAADQRMIKFVLMVNRQGQTRLSRYYQPVELSRRAALEADVVRCCLTRKKDQVPEVHTMSSFPPV